MAPHPAARPTRSPSPNSNSSSPRSTRAPRSARATAPSSCSGYASALRPGELSALDIADIIAKPAANTESDIMRLISEVAVVEQILIRNLPAGTKAALRARAQQHQQSVEAEAREILADALDREPRTLVDLLGTDEGADIEFEPERLGLTVRTPNL